MLLGASLYPALLWKPLDPHPYDVMSYHLQIPREWFDLGRIVQLHHNAFGYFPMGVEVHYLLAMHLEGGPWAGMYLCQMMSAAFAMLTGLAVVGAVRQFSGGGAMKSMLAWAAGLVTLCVPWTTMLGSVCYVESALMLYALLAVVWAMLALRDRNRTMPAMVLAGAFLGFACGIKYTAVAMSAVPLLAIWPVLAWRTSGRQILKPWIASILACGLLVSPWLIRNVCWTGNPVFPLATSIIGKGNFSADQIDRYAQAHTPPAAERGLPARLRSGYARVLTDSQFGYLFPSLAIAASVGLAVRRRFLLLDLSLAALVVVWLLATHDMPRFITPAIPLAAVAIALVLPCQTRWQTAGVMAFLLQAVIGQIWTWQTLAPSLEFGRAGFFRLPDPGPLDPPELQAAKRAGCKIALIGDAQAFGQAIDSRRLLYRNVFDVNIPPAVGTADGWLGKPVEQLRRDGYWVIVSSDELLRLSRTYAHIPAPAAPYDRAGEAPQILPPLP